MCVYMAVVQKNNYHTSNNVVLLLSSNVKYTNLKPNSH